MAGMRVGIVGGGVVGLVAAYELGKSEAQVTLFEQASRLGGLAVSFPMQDGQWIEKYYHTVKRELGQ
jgi:protoporphyrinogen oxidase